jgi:uncharacterized phage-associated protein
MKDMAHSISVTFNKDKTLQSILYLTNRLQRRDFHKVFKLLYFSDRKHLYDWGCPITGDTYIAMEAGPVPSRAYDMLKAVRGDSYFKDQEGLSDFFSVEGWMYIVPKREVDLDKLSASDVECLDWALKTYGSLSYDEIKEKSHDVAWRSTAKDFAIEWENIARESGMDNEELQYVAETQRLQQAML